MTEVALHVLAALDPQHWITSPPELELWASANIQNLDDGKLTNVLDWIFTCRRGVIVEKSSRCLPNLAGGDWPFMKLHR
jgi:uncharacterized protein YqcC (DUF446 family)